MVRLKSSAAGVEMADSLNVLVVDDDHIHSYALGKRLRVSGFRVTSVRSGEEALREARSDTFDAVLLDLNLPDVDGFGVCAAIRAMTGIQQPAIIFPSAYSASES